MDIDNIAEHVMSYVNQFTKTFDIEHIETVHKPMVATLTILLLLSLFNGKVFLVVFNTIEVAIAMLMYLLIYIVNSKKLKIKERLENGKSR